MPGIVTDGEAAAVEAGQKLGQRLGRLQAGLEGQAAPTRSPCRPSGLQRLFQEACARVIRVGRSPGRGPATRPRAQVVAQRMACWTMSMCAAPGSRPRPGRGARGSRARQLPGRASAGGAQLAAARLRQVRGSKSPAAFELNARQRTSLRASQARRKGKRRPSTRSPILIVPWHARLPSATRD